MLKIRWFFLIFFISGMGLKAQGLQDWKTITYMNDITDMVRSENEIWVSTTGGIYKFIPEDSTYQIFTNIDGLGSLELTSIETDRYDHILASSRDGLINRYNRDLGLWKVYSSLKGEDIVDLFTHQDTLWVATKTGVGVFLLSEDKIEFRDFYNNFSVMVDNAYRICVNNRRVYYATEHGLFHASSNFIKNNLKISEAWERLTINDGLPANSVLDIVPTTDSLLVGTSSGAVSINEDNILSGINSWDKGKVSKILVSDSDMYFVNDRAYYRQIENSWIWIKTESSSITSGFIDNYSTLWIGLDRGGIKRSDWNSSFLIDGPASNHIGSLIKDRNGSLWISSGKFKLAQGEGFYHYDFDHWTNYKFYNNEWYRKNNVVTVYEDLTGKIWYGAWGGGISVVDDNNIEYIHSWLGDGRLEISTFNSKNEFIASEPGPEKRTCLSPAQVSLDDYLVTPYFLEDDNGNLWSANYLAKDANYLTIIPRNENGNLELDCTNWIYFGRNIGFSEDEGEVSALEYDDFNRLWIGTFGSG
ncbi:MAG: hypothetical protein KAS58_01505, partial [Calditrichia bacterium]|nr:hypothetical protein [Calditrichia bacterium]